MFLNQNSLQYKHYVDFEKYAKFICEKFDISVQLESTRAETDGRTIYLPNVLSMTEKELDMMYAILLHEAGHIRYSTFSESYFKRLKTKAHAFLANSIEDARIENLLMKDFGGAGEIFQSLYCDYTQDKSLMKKVFKHDGTKPDLFATLAFYAHNEIVNCETSTLKEISGARTANRILRFWRENQIAEMIAASKMNNDDDVINLTNAIYDLFVNTFHAKDKSGALDFNKADAEKKAIEKTLDALRQAAESVEQKVAELNEKVAKIEQDIENFERDHEEALGVHEQAIEELQENISDVMEKIKWKNELERNRKVINDIPAQLETAKKDLEKQLAEKTRLEQQLEKGLNGRGKEMTPEQKESTTKKLEVKKRQEERLNNRIEQLKSTLEDAKDMVKEATEQACKDPSSFNLDFDVEAAKEQLNSLSAEIKAEQDAMNKINAEKNRMISEQNSLIDQMNKVQSDFMEKTAEAMFSIDEKVRAEEFDVDVLPELNYQDSWPEAAAAQQAFDEKASKESGKLVRNGQKGAGLFGSNIRDIITFIDKKKEQVQEIDVAQIFKDKIHASKLDDMNSDVKHTNFMEDKSVVGVFGTRRELIPSTTEFDVVKKDNMSNKTQEMRELVAANAVFYRDLKRVFARKLKFAKKDFWRGSQEEGSLDARSLWKLPTNQGSDFYEVNNPKHVNKVAATILIDMSGSQNKEVTDYGKKILSLAVGLSQALEEVHIKHEVLGYHAPVSDEMRQMNSSAIYTRRSNRLETVVFKEAGQKGQMGLLNFEPQMSDNSDGESLRIALKRLKAIRAKSHMVFILSDGKPFLCDTDVSVLDEDFRAALRTAVRDRVQVFSLGFFEQAKNFFGERFCNATKNENVLKFFDQTSFV